MTDRIHLRALIDVSEETSHDAPWEMTILGNRLEPYFENGTGTVGEAVSHGECIRPFDDLYKLQLISDITEYDSLCSWLRFNPVHVHHVVIAADKPETIKRLSINVKRRTPFSITQRQWIPLAGLLDQDSECNTSLRVPLDVVLDGFTEVMIRAHSCPEDDENFDLIFEVDQVDDDRKRLK